MGYVKIRALILDYGGVISQPQNSGNVNNILQSLKLDIEDFKDVYRSQRAQYDCGQISGEEYWINILKHYGLEPADLEIAGLIRQDVESWTQIDERMIQFIIESRSKILKLAIMSNMTSDTLAYIREHYNWLELFDGLVFSCEVGISKPDREIYQACLSKLGLCPNECLFVDDSVENVKAAMELGMYAIQFKTYLEFKQEFAKTFCMTR